ncbi:MAG: hypothetical protein PHS92_03395 [Candidatus Gracilibacteria bacterium]|nr:hypothetical protein [Candidatus Gracilibacteria bacterium]
MNRIVIKIGTESLLNEEGRFDLRKPKVSSMIADIICLMERNVDVALVTSGAVGLGKSIVPRLEGYSDIAYKQTCAGVGQTKLIKEYSNAFAGYDISVSQILCTHADFHNKIRSNSLKNVFEYYFRSRILSIINENDLLTKEELTLVKSTSENDNLGFHVARLVEATEYMVITNTNGVYTGDPANPESVRIPILNEISNELLEASKSKSNSGTGGMHSKLKVAKESLNSGMRMHVLDGENSTVMDHFEGRQSGGTVIFR